MQIFPTNRKWKSCSQPFNLKENHKFQVWPEKKKVKELKQNPTPVVSQIPPQAPALLPEKEKYVQHLWQIGTAVITFKYYYTQKQHTSLRKKHTNVSGQLFSTRKKEYKTYTFLSFFFFFQPVGDRTSPTSKGNSIVGCFFFVGFYCDFFFFFYK